MNLGETIYRLRMEKNMSQGDLADALDVSRQSVSKWENSSAVPELEKLVKMSHLFGITLDELVGNEPPSAPPSQPDAQYIQENKAMPGHKIAGIILLCCGFVAFVAFTIVGYLTDAPLLGILLAAPFILNGTVCILCKNNTGFFCCWINYIPLFFVKMFFANRSVAGIFNLTDVVSLILLAALTVWSLYKLYKGHWGNSRVKKIIWTIILVIVLVLHLHLTVQALSTSVEIVNDGDSYSKIEVDVSMNTHPME